MLIAADFSRSVEFYHDKLGMKVKNKGEEIVDFETGGAILSVLDLKAAAHIFGENAVLAKAKQAGSRLELAVEVSGVDAVYQQLTEKGVKFLKSPADQPWGQRTADFTDPDGNIWEIYEWTKAQ